MKASQIPWPAWLAGAAVLLFFAFAIGPYEVFGNHGNTFIWVSLVVFLFVAGVLLSVVGLIRFLKWAWKD